MAQSIEQYARRVRRKGVKRGETVTVLPISHKGRNNRSMQLRKRGSRVKRSSYTISTTRGIDSLLVKREGRKLDKRALERALAQLDDFSVRVLLSQ